jgi:excisionase family DNA binding protein
MSTPASDPRPSATPAAAAPADVVLVVHGPTVNVLAIALQEYVRSRRRTGTPIAATTVDLLAVLASRATGRDHTRPGATSLDISERAPQGPAQQRQLLTKQEVAQVIGCSTRTVDRLVTAGRLVAVTAPHGTRVRRTDLTAYLASLPPTKEHTA